MTFEKEIDGELWIMADYHQWAVGAAETEWRYRYDAIKREADYWRKRHDAVLDMIVKNTLLMASPQPMMLADPESYELGKTHGAALEREACLNCYSPDDTATDWADKIRARGRDAP